MYPLSSKCTQIWIHICASISGFDRSDHLIYTVTQHPTQPTTYIRWSNLLFWLQLNLQVTTKMRDIYSLILKDNQLEHTQFWNRWLQLLDPHCNHKAFNWRNHMQFTTLKIKYSRHNATYTRRVPSGRSTPCSSISANVFQIVATSYVLHCWGKHLKGNS